MGATDRTGGAVTPERINQFINGHWASSIVSAACDHQIFTHIENGANTLEDIANRAGISMRGAAALLNGLEGLGLVQRQNGTYTNAPDASTFLVEDRPGNLTKLARFSSRQMPLWSRLAESVRTGIPGALERENMMDNEMWHMMVEGILPLTYPVAVAVGNHLKIAEAGAISILDVGGGSGVFSMALLSMNPQATVTQVDWGNVNELARKIVARQGVEDRFHNIDGDYYEADFGRGYDAAIYSAIAHNESPQGNLKLLRKIYDALRPGGRLIVADYILSDEGGSHPFPLMFGLNMLLNTTGGAAWRRSDYDTWLNEVGFTDIQVQEIMPPNTLVMAAKPG